MALKFEVLGLGTDIAPRVCLFFVFGKALHVDASDDILAPVAEFTITHWSDVLDQVFFFALMSVL